MNVQKALSDATLLRRSVNSAELTQIPDHFPSKLANSLSISGFPSVDLPAALRLPSNCPSSFRLVPAEINTGAFQPTVGLSDVEFINFAGHVAWWRNGRWIKRSRVRLPVGPLSSGYYFDGFVSVDR